MKIAIIGTGNIGGTLATHWSKNGHHIFLGVRDTGNFKGQDLLVNKNTSAHSILDAAQNAEIILVATPPQFAENLSRQFGNTNGKIIIDATNAVFTKPENYSTAFHAFADLTEAAVVKCFNSTGFENMVNPKYGDIALDMFMAGDDEAAKNIVKQLALEIGFAECYDFGGSNQVELLEKFALSWINLAIFQKTGRNIGFKLLKR